MPCFNHIGTISDIDNVFDSQGRPLADRQRLNRRGMGTQGQHDIFEDQRFIEDTQNDSFIDEEMEAIEDQFVKQFEMMLVE